MTEWTAGELRAAVLDALEPHGDERASDAVRSGELSIVPGVAAWQSSAGTTDAHRVVLALDAARLGEIRAHHGSVDVLAATVAAVVASRPRETMLELSLEWSAEGHVAASGYRDVVVSSPSLFDALLLYLEGAGEREVAAELVGAMVTRRASDVRIVFAPEPRARVRAHRRAEDVVVRALRDLLGNRALRVVIEG